MFFFPQLQQIDRKTWVSMSRQFEQEWDPSRKFAEDRPDSDGASAAHLACIDYDNETRSSATLRLYCAYSGPRRRDRAYLSKVKIPHLGESLARLIGEFIRIRCGGKASELYKAAGVRRGTFQGFMSVSARKGDKVRLPNKKILLQLALAMQLRLDEVNELLQRAGYALSDSIPFDVVIRRCIEEKVFNVFDVNEILEREGCVDSVFEIYK